MDRFAAFGDEGALVPGRGVEFSAAYRRQQAEQHLVEGTDYCLPIKQRIEDDIQFSGLQQASLSAPIPADNKGYILLQKMGWAGPGKGLGKNSDGRNDPIDLNALDAGLRLGLGKMQQDAEFTAAENISRKQLEAEIQMNEDESRREQRLGRVEQQARIQEDVKQILQTFYCEVCDKQYKYAAELEEHLSSYSHHHTKRLKEMRKMEFERTREQRERKALKSSQKEMARLNKQIMAAGGMPLSTPGSQPPPPSTDPPLPPLPPPLPPDDSAAAVSGGWTLAAGGSASSSGVGLSGAAAASVRGGWEPAEPSARPGGADAFEEPVSTAPRADRARSGWSQTSAGSGSCRADAVAQPLRARANRWDVSATPDAFGRPTASSSSAMGGAFARPSAAQAPPPPPPQGDVQPPLQPQPPQAHAPQGGALSFAFGSSSSASGGAGRALVKQPFGGGAGVRRGVGTSGRPAGAKIAAMFGDDADDSAT